MKGIGALTTTLQVLLVEDSAGDVRLTREAFQDAKVHIDLHVASDGAEAMAFLRHEGKHADAPRPDLILLDLNLPKKDGRAVLTEIKQDPSLQTIPVVILTTSASEEDVLKSYMLHANCYITKPVDLEGFLKVVKSIDNFWLTVVKLPHVTPS
jgi:two-component system, chemotaxis family, response regulator Rcp1